MRDAGIKNQHGVLRVSPSAHGDVTLPVDYVRDHVRLGSAATEHGWQSDTVDTAISLTSPATTRRGLYVAATRGRDTNTLCVVTDSDDVAEARDVLDAVLAVDRADVPATTQRRTLAPTLPRPASSPTKRCEVPEWFRGAAHRSPNRLPRRRGECGPFRSAANQRDRRRRHRRCGAGRGRSRHRRRPQRVACGRSSSRRCPTSPRRRPESLGNRPRRERRTARHDLVVAERQLERAEDYLARTRQTRCRNTLRRRTPAARPSAHHLEAVGRRSSRPRRISAHRRGHPQPAGRSPASARRLPTRRSPPAAPPSRPRHHA